MNCDYESISAEFPDQICSKLSELCFHSEDYFNFLELHHCSFNGQIFISLFLGILFIVILVYFIVTTANRYLMRSAQILSDKLSVPPTIAGVTFLALGSCPELFLVIFSSSIGMSGLNIAFGTVLGNLLSNTGFFFSMIIVYSSGINASKTALVRDITFMLICIIYVFLGMLIFNSLSLIQSAIYLTLFPLYIIFLLFQECYVSSHQALFEEIATDKELTSVSDYRMRDDDSFSLSMKSDEDETSSNDASNPHANCSKVEIKHLNEIADLMSNVLHSKKNAAALMNITTPTRNSSFTSSPNGIEQCNTQTLEEMLSSKFLRVKMNLVGINSLYSRIKVSQFKLQTSNDFQEESNFESTDMSQYTDKQAIQTGKKSIIKYYLTALLYYIIGFPLDIIRMLTIPAFAEDSYNYYCFCFNPLCTTLLIIYIFNLYKYVIHSTYVWISLVACVVLLTIIVIFCSRRRSAPKAILIMAIFNFAISLIWIYFASMILIHIMSSISYILGLPQTYIPLLIVSFGFNFSELKLYLTLAKKKLGGIAITETVTQSLFILSFGLGISLLRLNIIKGSLSVELETFDIIAFVIIIGNLFRLLLQSIIERFKLSKRGSYVGLTSYFLSFIAIIIIGLL